MGLLKMVTRRTKKLMAWALALAVFVAIVVFTIWLVVEIGIVSL